MHLQWDYDIAYGRRLKEIMRDVAPQTGLIDKLEHFPIEFLVQLHLVKPHDLVDYLPSADHVEHVQSQVGVDRKQEHEGGLSIVPRFYNSIKNQAPKYVDWIPHRLPHVIKIRVHEHSPRHHEYALREMKSVIVIHLKHTRIIALCLALEEEIRHAAKGGGNKVEPQHPREPLRIHVLVVALNQVLDEEVGEVSE